MTEELTARAAILAEESKSLAKEIDRARKALESLAEIENWNDPGLRCRSRDAILALRDRQLPDYEAFVESLDAELESFRLRLRQGFLDGLMQAVESSGLSARRLGDQPPLFDIAGIAVEVDFDKEHAELAYARERLARAPLDPALVLHAREEAVRELRSVWPGPESFHAACQAAYRARIARLGSRPGERIRLVDLICELSIEYELRGLWQEKSATRRLARVHLAYCLDQLARSGALTQRGSRLELGTATGGSAKDKKQVLFLEAGMGGGQYYLSLRFVEDAGRDDA